MHFAYFYDIQQVFIEDITSLVILYKHALLYVLYYSVIFYQPFGNFLLGTYLLLYTSSLDNLLTKTFLYYECKVRWTDGQLLQHGGYLVTHKYYMINMFSILQMLLMFILLYRISSIKNSVVSERWRDHTGVLCDKKVLNILQ